MRKITITIALIIAAAITNGQTLWTLSGSDVTTATTGNCTVGGNVSVTGNTAIGGNASIAGGLIDMTIPGTWSSTTEPWRSLNCGATYAGLWLNTGTTTLDGTYIQMFAPQHLTNPGGMILVSNSPGAYGNGFSFVHHDFSSSADNSLMDLDNWGHLRVKGGLLELNSSALGSDQWRSINCGSAGKGLYLCTGSSTSDGTYIQMHSPGETNAGTMEFVSNSPAATGMGFRFIHHDFSASTDNNMMSIDNWGKLTVNGGLINLRNLPGSDAYRSVNCGSYAGGLYLCTGNTTADGTYIQMHAPGESNPGAMEFVSNSPGAYGTGFKFLHHDYSSGAESNMMSLDNWGKLTVNGGLINLLTLPGTDNFRSINCGSPAGGLYMCTGNTTTDGSYIQMHSPGESSNAGGIEIVSNSVAGTGSGITFCHYDGATKNDMRIYNSGKVVIAGPGHTVSDINTSTTAAYGLYVGVGILTEHVKVASHSSTSWADFVFSKDYKLMPLSKVEEFVSKHKHLPEIPSATDVENDGIDLAEIDAKLLQKIEELTLYVINQQKRIEILEKQVNSKK